MTNYFLPLLLTILNYLLGSVSSAILVARYTKKEDIREIGYQTAGGSNVAQNIGLKWGIIVAVFDFLKGIPILALAKYLEVDEHWLSVIAIASVAGHCWPIWFNFSGGRGVGTLLGVIVFLTFKASIIPFIIFVLTIVPSLLRRKAGIEWKWISSPTMTLFALGAYIYLTFQTKENFDELLALSLTATLLLRRVTARLSEYKSSQKPLKLFLSRLLFDNSTSLS
ncbi:glycerol-3-phosphate acyltransferase [Candidatus Dojkabacteria bacterium]|nr:glycerol-3-phosphate acyltransferase [Candidatus Dojkabacteria bacterium]